MDRSFEGLASFLADETPSLQKEFSIISKKIKGEERSLKIRHFLKKRLKSQSNWLLIFDDLKLQYGDILKYLMTDSEECGHGNILITTRNSNIRLAISPKNVFDVPLLTDDEKQKLFYQLVHLPTNNPQKTIELETILKKIPSFPLDVSVMSYYVSQESFDFKGCEKDFWQERNSQKDIFSFISSYKETRYKILSMALEEVMHKNPSFKEMMLFIALINHNNIPVSFLEEYYGKEITEEFIFLLQKNSFITKILRQNELKYFSIHETIHEILKAHLDKFYSKQEKIKYSHSIQQKAIKFLKNYSSEEIYVNHFNMIYHHMDTFYNQLIKINMNPEFDLSFFLALSSDKNGFIKRAIEILRKELEVHYSQPEKTSKLYFQLGVINARYGDYKQSFFYFNKISALHENELLKANIDADLLNIYLGASYYHQGLYENAVKYYEKGRESAKRNGKSYIYLRGTLYIARIKLHQRKVREAECYVKEASKVISSEEQMNWVNMYKSCIEFYKNNLDESLVLLKKSLNFYEKSLGIYNHVSPSINDLLSMVEIKRGNIQKGIKHAQHMLEIMENIYGKDHVFSYEAYLAMGRAYFYAQDYSNAEFYLIKGLNIIHNKFDHLSIVPLKILKVIYEKKNLGNEMRDLIKKYGGHFETSLSNITEEEILLW